MTTLLHLFVVFGVPGSYALYVSVKESQVSGYLARRLAAQRAREREIRLNQAWEAKGREQARALEAWRRNRSLPERVNA